MAWARSELSAALQAKMQADKPIIVAESALAAGGYTGKWIQTAETWASSDRAAAGYGLDRMGSGHPSLVSFPSLTGPTVTTVRAVFSLPSVAFDAVGLFNLAPIAFDQTITVQIADDSTFATNPQTIAQWTDVQPRRLAEFSLLHFDDPVLSPFQQYTGVDWLRVTWTSASNLFGSGLRLGELWLGRRRQMAFRSDVGGFDDFEMDGRASVFDAQSGDRWKYQAFGGRGVRRLRFRPHGGESIDQVTALRGMFQDCAYGNQPVMYCEKPNTEPNNSMVMSFEGEALALPIENYRNRTFDGVLFEQSPFLADEVAF